MLHMTDLVFVGNMTFVDQFTGAQGLYIHGGSFLRGIAPPRLSDAFVMFVVLYKILYNKF